MSTENKFKKQTVTVKKTYFTKKSKSVDIERNKKGEKEGKKQNIKRICNKVVINIV